MSAGNGITVPGGDGVQLETASSELQAAATGAGNLGVSTRQTTTGIRDAAD